MTAHPWWVVRGGGGVEERGGNYLSLFKKLKHIFRVLIHHNFFTEQTSMAPRTTGTECAYLTLKMMAVEMFDNVKKSLAEMRH